MTKRLALAVAAGCGLLLCASTTIGGPSCSFATEEVRKAQEALSATTREHDQRAADLHGCMARSRHKVSACRAEREALTTAMQRNRQARDAYRLAQARKQQACR